MVQFSWKVDDDDDENNDDDDDFDEMEYEYSFVEVNHERNETTIIEENDNKNNDDGDSSSWTNETSDSASKDEHSFSLSPSSTIEQEDLDYSSHSLPDSQQYALVNYHNTPPHSQDLEPNSCYQDENQVIPNDQNVQNNNNNSIAQNHNDNAFFSDPNISYMVTPHPETGHPCIVPIPTNSVIPRDVSYFSLAVQKILRHLLLLTVTITLFVFLFWDRHGPPGPPPKTNYGAASLGDAKQEVVLSWNDFLLNESTRWIQSTGALLSVVPHVIGWTLRGLHVDLQDVFSSSSKGGAQSYPPPRETTDMDDVTSKALGECLQQVVDQQHQFSQTTIKGDNDKGKKRDKNGEQNDGLHNVCKVDSSLLNPTESVCDSNNTNTNKDGNKGNKNDIKFLWQDYFHKVGGVTSRQSRAVSVVSTALHEWLTMVGNDNNISGPKSPLLLIFAGTVGVGKRHLAQQMHNALSQVSFTCRDGINLHPPSLIFINGRDYRYRPWDLLPRIQAHITATAQSPSSQGGTKISFIVLQHPEDMFIIPNENKNRNSHDRDDHNEEAQSSPKSILSNLWKELSTIGENHQAPTLHLPQNVRLVFILSTHVGAKQIHQSLKHEIIASKSQTKPIQQQQDRSLQQALAMEMQQQLGIPAQHTTTKSIMVPFHPLDRHNLATILQYRVSTLALPVASLPRAWRQYMTMNLAHAWVNDFNVGEYMEWKTTNSKSNDDVVVLMDSIASRGGKSIFDPDPRQRESFWDRIVVPQIQICWQQAQEHYNQPLVLESNQPMLLELDLDEDEEGVGRLCHNGKDEEEHLVCEEVCRFLLDDP